MADSGIHLSPSTEISSAKSNETVKTSNGTTSNDPYMASKSNVMTLMDNDMDDVNACLNGSFGEFEDDLDIDAEPLPPTSDLQFEDELDQIYNVLNPTTSNASDFPAQRTTPVETNVFVNGETATGTNGSLTNGETADNFPNDVEMKAYPNAEMVPGSLASDLMPPPKVPIEAPKDNFDTRSVSGRSTTSTNATGSTFRRQLPSQSYRFQEDNIEKLKDAPPLIMKDAIYELDSLDNMIKSGRFFNETEKMRQMESRRKRLNNASRASSRRTSCASLNTSYSSGSKRGSVYKAWSKSFRGQDNTEPYPKRRVGKNESGEIVSLASKSAKGLEALEKLKLSGFNMLQFLDGIKMRYGDKYEMDAMKKVHEIQGRPLSYACGDLVIVPTDGRGTSDLEFERVGTNTSLNFRFS